MDPLVLRNTKIHQSCRLLIKYWCVGTNLPAQKVLEEVTLTNWRRTAVEQIFGVNYPSTI